MLNASLAIAHDDVHSIPYPDASFAAHAVGHRREPEMAAQRFGNGEALYYQGDPAENLFEILEGVVKLYMLTPDGRRQVTSFCFPGRIVGQGTDASYPQTAEAVGPVVVRRHTRSRFDGMMSERPELARRLLQMTLDELVVAQDQMLILGRKTATERLATFLQRLVARHSDKAAERPVLHLPMPRTDIADYLGLTPETVSRVLGRLKAQGIIALKSANDLEIRDPDQLALLAEDETACLLN